MTTDVESKVLEREIGKLGGSGARWITKLLPCVAHEIKFDLPCCEEAASFVASSLSSFSQPIPELPSIPAEGTYYALVGSGHLNMNPTVIRVKIEGHTISIRGVAKEGLVKQHSARRAVERFEQIFRNSIA